SSIVASWSSTPSASSPSTVSVTWSPVFAPSEMTPRMLAALTGAPSPLAIVTVWPEFLAASENSFAGRACRPWEDAMVTVRVAMVFPFVGGAAGADPSEGVLNERERPRAIAIARDVGGERHDGDPARGREGEDVACRLGRVRAEEDCVCRRDVLGDRGEGPRDRVEGDPRRRRGAL